MMLFVFDFDGTLLNAHLSENGAISGKATINEQGEITYFYQNSANTLFRDRENMVGLIKQLVQNGHQVAICTESVRPDLVRYLLDELMGEDHTAYFRDDLMCFNECEPFVNLLPNPQHPDRIEINEILALTGRGEGARITGEGKNTRLSQLAAHAGVAQDQVVLIDDRESNVHSTLKYPFFGIHAIPARDDLANLLRERCNAAPISLALPEPPKVETSAAKAETSAAKAETSAAKAETSAAKAETSAAEASATTHEDITAIKARLVQLIYTKYLERKPSNFFGLGKNHRGRAEAVRTAIQQFTTKAAITALVEIQLLNIRGAAPGATLLQQIPSTASGAALFDTRWTNVCGHLKETGASAEPDSEYFRTMQQCRRILNQ